MSTDNGGPKDALTHSETFGEIMAALVAVQEDVGSVKKTETNPHFGNTYADINAFLHALREPLSNHGIYMTQAPGVDGENVTVDTLLYHKSGEWLRNRAASPMPKSDPQGVGSAITYLRRYSLAALFAVPQEDDDGNRASKRGDGGRRQAEDTEESGYACPECGSTNMWDNRADKKAGKRSKKFPDFKCRECDHPIWGSHPDEKDEDDFASIKDEFTSFFVMTFGDAGERQRNRKAFCVAHPDLPDFAGEWTEDHYRLAVHQLRKAKDSEGGLEGAFKRAMTQYTKMQAESMGAKTEEAEEEEEQEAVEV